VQVWTNLIPAIPQSDFLAGPGFDRWRSFPEQLLKLRTQFRGILMLVYRNCMLHGSIQ
jgi:hypothetical protein